MEFRQMFKMYRVSLGIIITTALAFAGCTAYAPGNPVLPSGGQLVFTDNPSVSAPPSGRYAWGVFDVAVDPSADEPIIFTPLRDASFHMNIRKYLEDNPCADCLQISNFQITSKGFKVDVSITNPFDTGSNFYGFDVRGIFYFGGSCIFPQLEVIAPSPLKGDAYLVNPDGYTTIFNAVDYPGNGLLGYSKGNLVPMDMYNPNANLGMFMAFHSEEQSEEHGGRRGFFPGDTVTRQYEIVTPSNGSLHYGYAIDACWDLPNISPPTGVDDFPLTANCYEPYRVDITEVKNDLTPYSGSVSLRVIAYDHQGSGGIIECRAEAPGLTDKLLIDDTPDPMIGGIAAFDIVIPCGIGAADVMGEEVLIEIVHSDPDPNLGIISAWAFTIVDVAGIPETPHIASIIPDKGYQNTIAEVTITGTGFHPNPFIELYKGMMVIPAENIEVVDPFTIKASFNLSAPLGFYTLYIENQNGHWGELTDAFEILDQ